MTKKPKSVWIIGTVALSITAVLAIFIALGAIGVFSVKKTKLVIVSDSAEVVYNGSALTAEDYSIVEGGLKPGHNIEVTFSGKQTEVGECYNDFSVIITDKNGVDVTKDEYDLELRKGVLSVQPRTLLIRSFDAEKSYDGTPLTNDEYQLVLGTLAEGDELSVQVTGSRQDVGTSNNTMVATVINNKNKDVSYNYFFEYDEGILKVNGKLIVIETPSREKVYDGQPLTMASYNILHEELQDGHVMSVVVTGTQTDAGESDNTVSIAIVDEEGVSVIGQYDIQLELGTLNVHSRKVSIVSGTASKVYDGTPLVCKSYEVTSDSQLLEGHTVSASYGASLTQVGVTDNYLTDIKVVDSEGNDVTANYEIDEHNGRLMVTARRITVQADSAEKIYDGRALTAPNYAIVSLTDLADGQSISVKIDGSQTAIGKATNRITDIIIRDQSGKDVTSNYDITSQNGELVVKEGEISVGIVQETAKDEIKRVSQKARSIVDELGGEDGWKSGLSKAAKQDAKNKISAARNIILEQISNANTVADAEEMAEEGKETLDDLLKDIVSGNEMLEQVSDEVGNGAGLESDKEIISDALSGIVSDAKKFISASDISAAQKNQMEQSLDEIETQQSSLIDSATTLQQAMDALEDSVEAIREVLDNDILWDPIDLIGEMKGEGGKYLQSLAEKYKDAINQSYNLSDAEKELGKSLISTALHDSLSDLSGSNDLITAGDIFNDGMEALEDAFNSTGGTGSPKEPGSMGGLDKSGKLIGGFTPNGEAGEMATVVEVLSEVGGRVYLKAMSFGDYTGNNWEAISAYSTKIDNKYSMDYLTGAALANADRQKNSISIKNYRRDYLLPYYMDMGDYEYDVQSSDVEYQGNVSKQYSLYYYQYDYKSEGLGSISLAEDYSVYEESYRSYVYSHYLSIPTSSKLYFDALIEEKGWNKTQSGIINKVVSFIRTAATYSLDYDRNMDKEDDIAVAFLNKYKTGICMHYASAATLLFRSLGFAARYTIGYAVNVKAGEWSVVTTMQAHAWVEVYLDGIGWIMLEVTGSDGLENLNGGEQPQKTPIVLTPVDVSMQYDGVTELKAKNELKKDKLLQNLLNMGYTYEVVVSGKRREAGVTKSVIESFTLIDPDGKDVTDNFDWENHKKTGNIRVYLEEITIYTDGGEKMYDGTPLVVKSYNVEGNIVNGHRIKYLRTTGEAVNVGSYANSYEILIEDANGHSVNDNYLIKSSTGMLMITARTITIEVNDATKHYDGTPLEPASNGYEIKGEGLADGDSATVTLIGSQTNIGRSQCTAVVEKIINENNEDVTKNYSVNTENGILRVTR